MEISNLYFYFLGQNITTALRTELSPDNVVFHPVGRSSFDSKDVPQYFLSERKLFIINPFTIDPYGSKLLIFFLNTGIIENQIAVLIFQIDSNNSMKQLNTLPESNYKIITYQIGTIYNVNLYPIPSGIIQNIDNLIKTNNKQLTPDFIDSLKHQSFLLKLTMLPNLDIKILSDIDYVDLQKYTQYDFYLSKLITSNEFFMVYISKQFNEQIVDDKPKTMSYSEYYQYLRKATFPIINFEQMNSIIENNLFSVFKYILDEDFYAEIYMELILNDTAKHDDDLVLNKIIKTKNITFIEYYLNFLINYDTTNEEITIGSAFDITKKVILTGDINLLNQIIIFFNSIGYPEDVIFIDLPIFYYSSLKSGNLETVKFLIKKYNIVEQNMFVGPEVVFPVSNIVIDIFKYSSIEIIKYLFDRTENRLIPDNFFSTDVEFINKIPEIEKRGDLEILKYFFSKYDYTFDEDYFEMFREHYPIPEMFETQLLENICLSGKLNTFLFYYQGQGKKYTIDITETMLFNSIISGNYELFLFIKQKIDLISPEIDSIFIEDDMYQILDESDRKILFDYHDDGTKIPLEILAMLSNNISIYQTLRKSLNTLFEKWNPGYIFELINYNKYLVLDHIINSTRTDYNIGLLFLNWYMYSIRKNDMAIDIYTVKHCIWNYNISSQELLETILSDKLDNDIVSVIRTLYEEKYFSLEQIYLIYNLIADKSKYENFIVGVFVTKYIYSIEDEIVDIILNIKDPIIAKLWLNKIIDVKPSGLGKRLLNKVAKNILDENMHAFFLECGLHKYISSSLGIIEYENIKELSTEFYSKIGNMPNKRKLLGGFERILGVLTFEFEYTENASKLMKFLHDAFSNNDFHISKILINMTKLNDLIVYCIQFHYSGLFEFLDQNYPLNINETILSTITHFNEIPILEYILQKYQFELDLELITEWEKSLIERHDQEILNYLTQKGYLN